MNTVTSQASKAEEMDALIKGIRRLANRFENGTYIHDLFSEHFLSWVEGQLRNDFPPDIMDALQAAVHAQSKAEAEVNRLNFTLQTANDNYARDMAVQSQLFQNEISTLRESLQHETERAEYFRKQSGEHYDELVATQQQADIVSGALDDAVKEITALKAKLYDLQNPK